MATATFAGILQEIAGFLATGPTPDEILCEHCLLHEEDAMLAHQPDHVIAVKHRGVTHESNLAWAW